jgi:hypothetical protein
MSAKTRAQMATPYETAAFIAMAEEMIRLGHFKHRTEVALFVGYADVSTFTEIWKQERQIPKERYETLREAYEAIMQGPIPKGVLKVEPPVARQEKKEASAVPSVLEELRDIHEDLGDVIQRLYNLSNRSVPLLRPGIFAYAKQLEEGRKVLVIS